MISVVIASKNRRELAQRVVEAVRMSLSLVSETSEIILVDDASVPAYRDEDFPEVRLLRGAGRGPALARTAGVRAASGDIILFTDDDVIVDEGWAGAAVSRLRAEPDIAGVTGDTSSPPYDPLYEHSVEDHDGGSFLTCNIAYRRDAFIAVGGFDRQFPHAAHEDRDLAWRVIAQVGPVVFEPSMKVVHPGRAFAVLPWWKRGRLVVDDWLLLGRYPERQASRRSLRVAPLTGAAHRWWSVRPRGASPRRWFRWLLVASGQLAVSAWFVITAWKGQRDRSREPISSWAHDKYRIAYIGPSPDPSAGGAPGVAGLIVAELLTRGHQVDVFVAASREDDDPRGLGDRPGLRYVIERSSFQFEKWYSSSRLSKMIASQLFTARARRRLRAHIEAQHLATPYDFVYQFSTFESVGVPRRPDLPVFIHPSVHAAGEARWIRAEATSGLSSRPRWATMLVYLWMSARALRQASDANRATGILALSSAMAQHIEADYGVSARQLRVVPNCLDPLLFERPLQPMNDVVSVVGRLVVRKGLDDMARTVKNWPTSTPVTFEFIGAESLWSDYRRVIDELDDERVVRVGHLSRAETIDHIARARVLVQASRYEPFGLTVAEALAVGVPVVITKEVGAAEGVDPRVCRVIDIPDANSRAVRHWQGSATEAIIALWDLPSELREVARQESRRLFHPRVVVTQLEDAWRELLHREG